MVAAPKVTFRRSQPVKHVTTLAFTLLFIEGNESPQMIEQIFATSFSFVVNIFSLCY